MIVRFRSALARSARPALALAAGAAVMLAAGCGGSGGGSGQDAASAAQDQVVPVLRALYQRIYHAHIGWAAGMSGQYEQCLTSSSQSELDFHGIIYYIYPFSSSGTANAYRQDIVNAAKADGWTFKAHISGSRDGNLFPYQMEKGPLNGHVSVSGAPPGTKSYKFTGLIEVESTCFDAGSAAHSLSQHTSTYPLPRPSPPPSP